jgi:hypothetical protein
MPALRSSLFDTLGFNGARSHDCLILFSFMGSLVFAGTLTLRNGSLNFDGTHSLTRLRSYRGRAIRCDTIRSISGALNRPRSSGP